MAAKRQRSSSGVDMGLEPSARPESASAGNDSEAKRGEIQENASSSADSESKRDEIQQNAARLAVHITSPKKFNKVAAMLYSLLQSDRVTAQNANAFFSILCAGVAATKMLRRPELRVAYAQLYAAAVERKNVFPTDTWPTIDLWSVRVLAQLDLYTDDTYQFSRTCRSICSHLERLPCVWPALEATCIKEGSSKHIVEDERREWADAVFDCIEVAMDHFQFTWARSSIDSLVCAAMDRRGNFDADQVSLLSGWLAQCKGHKLARHQEGSQLGHGRGKGGDMTSFERKEAEWQKAQVSVSGKRSGGSQVGNLDNWLSRQDVL